MFGPVLSPPASLSIRQMNIRIMATRERKDTKGSFHRLSGAFCALCALLWLTVSRMECAIFNRRNNSKHGGTELRIAPGLRGKKTFQLHGGREPPMNSDGHRYSSLSRPPAGVRACSEICVDLWFIYFSRMMFGPVLLPPASLSIRQINIRIMATRERKDTKGSFHRLSGDFCDLCALLWLMISRMECAIFNRRSNSKHGATDIHIAPGLRASVAKKHSRFHSRI